MDFYRGKLVAEGKPRSFIGAAIAAVLMAILLFVCAYLLQSWFDNTFMTYVSLGYAAVGIVFLAGALLCALILALRHPHEDKDGNMTFTPFPLMRP